MTLSTTDSAAVRAFVAVGRALSFAHTAETWVDIRDRSAPTDGSGFRYLDAEHGPVPFRLQESRRSVWIPKGLDPLR